MGNILRDEKEIFSRWTEYFKDLLNPIRATFTDKCNEIDFGKKEVFTLMEVTTAIRGLKSRKTAGKDEIRPEMLKALNGEGIRLLSGGVELEKIPKDWQTDVIIPMYKKGNRKKCTNY